MLNNIELLFIRACKVNDPRKRVKSVYRRFYLRGTSTINEDFYIAGILLGICEKYLPINPSHLLSELSPTNKWKHPQTEYWSRVSDVLIDHIRFSVVKGIEGFIPPRKFRK